MNSLDSVFAKHLTKSCSVLSFQNIYNVKTTKTNSISNIKLVFTLFTLHHGKQQITGSNASLLWLPHVAVVLKNIFVTEHRQINSLNNAAKCIQIYSPTFLIFNSFSISVLPNDFNTSISLDDLICSFLNWVLYSGRPILSNHLLTFS